MVHQLDSIALMQHCSSFFCIASTYCHEASIKNVISNHWVEGKYLFSTYMLRSMGKLCLYSDMIFQIFYLNLHLEIFTLYCIMGLPKHQGSARSMECGIKHKWKWNFLLALLVMLVTNITPACVVEQMTTCIGSKSLKESCVNWNLIMFLFQE